MSNSKNKLHPRNFHNKPYNFQELILKVPELKLFIVKIGKGMDTLQFANQKAVYFFKQSFVVAFL